MKQFRERLGRLRAGIATLESTLDPAVGFAKQASYIDLQVAKLFEEYISWELDHPEITKEAVVHNETFPGYLSGERAEDADMWEGKQHERYAVHIDHELTGTMALLARAEERLERDVTWPESPAADWKRLVFENGYFRINGRPMFTAGFNFFGGGTPRFDSLLETMRELGVGIITAGVPVSGLITEDGSVSGEAIEKIVAAIQRYGRMGFKVDAHLSWSKNVEVLEPLWPGITEYDGNFFGLDIDHPGTNEIVVRVMAELMPALKDLDEIVTWDMANEPYFETKMWSPYSLKRYRGWLADKYSTVEQLNSSWQSAYPEFESVPHPDEVPRHECSVGEWHDRVTFNRERVTSFFALVSAEIRKYVPDALVHLKGQDNNSLGPVPDTVAYGIDREMLGKVTQLHGVDTRPLPVTEPRMAAKTDVQIMNYDGASYGLHWLGQSFLYDYLRSLEPEQPIVDFEYHAFSINAIRVPDIDPGHARVTLWLAHLHGLIGNAVWYWHQRSAPDPFPDHYMKLWFYGSISTQPLLAAEYFQTMLEMNAFSREVEALATQAERPVRLLVSKPSYDQNTAHIAALHRAYEGVCFHGLRAGLVTEQMLMEKGIPGDCRVIILPDVEYVDEHVLRILEDARTQGIELVVVGERKPSLDPHGRPHGPEAVSFLEDVPVVDYAGAREIHQQFDALLSELCDKRELRVNVAGADDAFGVIHREARVDGRLVLLLVNVSAKAIDIEVRSAAGKPISGYDELGREQVDGAAIRLPVLGVRLIGMRSASI